jgi:hypothetical protein
MAKTNTKKTEEFDFRTIKSFKDACKKLDIDSLKVPKLLGEFNKPIIAAYKLMVIYKAINNGWVPDWSDFNQYKYYPWLSVLPSGHGIFHSHYSYVYTITDVGSRLCTDTSEKASYIAEQFETEYREYFFY